MSSSGADAGAKAGEGIKGAWNAFDSAGEAIRGTLNGAIDGAGKAVVGNDTASTDQRAAHDAAIQRDDATASRGMQQVKGVFDKLSGSGSSSGKY